MHRHNKKRLNTWSIVALVVATCVSWQPFEARADWKERWETAVREGKQEGKVVVFGPPGDPIRQTLTLDTYIAQAKIVNPSHLMIGFHGPYASWDPMGELTDDGYGKSQALVALGSRGTSSRLTIDGF